MDWIGEVSRREEQEAEAERQERGRRAFWFQTLGLRFMCVCMIPIDHCG